MQTPLPVEIFGGVDVKKKYSDVFIDIVYSDSDVLSLSDGKPFDDGDIDIGDMFFD